MKRLTFTITATTFGPAIHVDMQVDMHVDIQVDTHVTMHASMQVTKQVTTRLTLSRTKSPREIIRAEARQTVAVYLLHRGKSGLHRAG